MKLLNSIQGDRALWVILTLLAIFSFLPVFSASSNLVYVVGKGTPWGYLVKHFVILTIGFFFMYLIHRVPNNYFKGVSILLLPVVILLLIYTASQGTIINGANASRWIRIPIVGLSFQTSTLALVVTMIYVAQYLSKNKNNFKSFIKSILVLWLPVAVIIGLILPSNLSTAALLFLVVLVLCFIGGYPIQYLLGIVCSGVGFFVLFFMTSRAYPEAMPNRVDTWMSRIENFNDSSQSDGSYQIDRAKMAIATGKIFGLGAGKSRMKNFLPQSSTDFIYAIIIEEFGLVGGLGLLLIYLLLLFRVVVIAHRATTTFGKLLVIGLGLPILGQALINMGVAVQILPVTGQTLPMISSGGTSAWMTCIALGMILSVSASKNQDPEFSFETTDNPIKILSETP
tara:strand:- start:16461 stop:17654 length:1194 start_codon:yes stop_codon:yes gene_type:complete